MRNKEHFFVSEHLWTAKIPCYEGVRKYRVHKIGVFSEKRGCPNIYSVRIFRVNTVLSFQTVKLALPMWLHYCTALYVFHHL